MESNLPPKNPAGRELAPKNRAEARTVQILA